MKWVIVVGLTAVWVGVMVLVARAGAQRLYRRAIAAELYEALQRYGLNRHPSGGELERLARVDAFGELIRRGPGLVEGLTAEGAGEGLDEVATQVNVLRSSGPWWRRAPHA